MLKPVNYLVEDEQPPYTLGHQNLNTFTKLFIHNIDFDVTREHIFRLFAIFGRVKYINMPFDNKNRPRGLAFVTFWEHEDGQKALQGGKNMILGNRKLRVEIFKPLETLN
jgi:RNA recognition motif-containing protein